jgi:hypothetical protein
MGSVAGLEASGALVHRGSAQRPDATALVPHYRSHSVLARVLARYAPGRWGWLARSRTRLARLGRTAASAAATPSRSACPRCRQPTGSRSLEASDRGFGLGSAKHAPVLHPGGEPSPTGTDWK